MKSKLWKLFTTTFTLSAFTFGGGFVIVSLYQKKFVEELNWLDSEEMLDIVAIAQSSPGPIPVNASVILGYRLAGIKGTLTAVLGTILPPFIIMSLISQFYVQFKSFEIVSIAMLLMRAGVAAVILDVVYGLAKKVIQTQDLLHVFVMIVAFVGVYFFGFSSIMVVVGCLLLGIILAIYNMKQGGVA